jgi:multicomponent Na+:H+ antiporter subunit E
MTNALLVNLVLALVWCGLVGSAAIENLLVGFVLGYGISWLVSPLTGSAYPRRLAALVALSLFLLKEIVRATARVAWEVITPWRLRRPGIVAVPLDVATDGEITLLANMITLTPGTLSLDVSEDRRTLFVHAMFGGDPEAVRQEIKEGFERRVLRLSRGET